jgi:hypothetical protein
MDVNADLKRLSSLIKEPMPWSIKSEPPATACRWSSRMLSA